MTPATIGDGSFPAGTAIAVPAATTPNEVAVETLARGDTVLSMAGPARLRHVGTTTLDPHTQPAARDVPARLVPVRVAAGAFGDGLPRHDLLLPPQQMVYIRDASIPEGALVPLGALVNATSIRREPQNGPVTWHRLELEGQGVVFAAGLPLAARHDPTAPPFAQAMLPGPAIFRLRSRLAHRAEQAAAPPPEPEPAPAPEPAPEPESPPAPSGPDMSAAPDAATMLRIVAGSRALAALPDSTATHWHFTLPAGEAALHLVSPRGVPATTTPAQRAAARRYGIAVRAIHLADIPVPLDGSAIGPGFHALESAGTQHWRWTDGHATLTVEPASTDRRLVVEITDWHTLLLPD